MCDKPLRHVKSTNLIGGSLYYLCLFTGGSGRLLCRCLLLFIRLILGYKFRLFLRNGSQAIMRHLSRRCHSIGRSDRNTCACNYQRGTS